MTWDIEKEVMKNFKYRAKCKKYKYFTGKTETIRVPSLLVEDVYKFIEERDREFFERSTQIKY